MLPPEARERRAPVVVTASGSVSAGSVGPRVRGVAGRGTDRRDPGRPHEPSPRGDLRALAPEWHDAGPGAGDERGVATAPTASPRGGSSRSTFRRPRGRRVARLVARTTSRAVRLPRRAPCAPRCRSTTSSRGSTALVDWPVAFAFGCLTPPPLTGGTAGIPPWRVTPPGLADTGEIEVAPTTGGPFLTPRLPGRGDPPAGVPRRRPAPRRRRPRALGARDCPSGPCRRRSARRPSPAGPGRDARESPSWTPPRLARDASLREDARRVGPHRPESGHRALRRRGRLHRGTGGGDRRSRGREGSSPAASGVPTATPRRTPAASSST